mmetsp:Transcript_118004/g.341131  ORF Transcript_118004/g.341131 Transcript_118004/m.341131 type:complete len:215 (-) Transcript_118004:476-1120(-)
MLDRHSNADLYKRRHCRRADYGVVVAEASRQHLDDVRMQSSVDCAGGTDPAERVGRGLADEVATVIETPRQLLAAESLQSAAKRLQRSHLPDGLRRLPTNLAVAIADRPRQVDDNAFQHAPAHTPHAYLPKRLGRGAANVRPDASDEGSHQVADNRQKFSAVCREHGAQLRQRGHDAGTVLGGALVKGLQQLIHDPPARGDVCGLTTDGRKRGD